MSVKELRSYRLSSMEEPTDEMLEVIMQGVAREARLSSQRVKMELQRRFDNLYAEIRASKSAL